MAQSQAAIPVHPGLSDKSDFFDRQIWAVETRWNLPKRQFSAKNRSIRVGSGAARGSHDGERAKLTTLLQEADRYSQAGDLARADKRYRAALKRAPNDPPN